MILTSQLDRQDDAHLIDEHVNERTIDSLNRALTDAGLDVMCPGQTEDIGIMLGEHRAMVAVYRNANAGAHRVRAELRLVASGSVTAYRELSADALGTLLHYEHQGHSRIEAARIALDDVREVGRPDTQWRRRLVRAYLAVWQRLGGDITASASGNAPLGRWVFHLLTEAEGAPVDRKTVRELVGTVEPFGVA